MAAFKLTGFKGVAPKISPELLDEQSAQIARNCKLYSGDLIPFPEPVIKGMTGRTSGIKTIYPLRNPTTADLVWLSWEDVVNVATPSFSTDEDEQRFYYTGDGVPKVSTYALATSGPFDAPADYYELGLPLPEDKAIATEVPFTTATTASVARDAAGLVTLVTASPHELRTGVFVAVSGLSYLTGSYSRSGTTITVTLNNHGISNGSTVYLTKTSGNMTDGAYVVSAASTNTFTVTDPESGSTSGNLKLDIRSYTTNSSEITVIDDTTFTYFAPGFQQTTYAITDGKVDISGNPILRSYVYTWYTPWDEESIASEPSEFLSLREGIAATITNLPVAPPTTPAKNFIRGIRLYRPLASDRDADFFRLMTLWFPASTASVSRAANVSTVTMEDPHNFIEGDRFKIAAATNSSFNITDGIVVDIVDDYTFTYNQAGVDVAETADTTGVLYHDAAEDLDHDSRYWGDGSFDFLDDFDSRFLTEILTSDEYEAPPEELIGLKVIQNNILVGFVNNKLRFSEPDFPHAWPSKYEKTLDYKIVAVEPLSAVGALVLTEGFPYIVSGSDPAVMSVTRVDALYPCLNARGVVAMSYGVVFPTTTGLALYSPNSGPSLITNPIYEQDTWSTEFDPSSVVAEYYDDMYFASHTTGSFVYNYDSNGASSFVDCDEIFSSIVNDKRTGRVYFTREDVGDIFEWDNLEQANQVIEWKSKVIVNQDYINLGAARVVADYVDVSENWEDIDVDWEDYDVLWNASDGVTFTLYVDKEEVFTRPVTNKSIFRLPTGYRSDTFEFKITGDIRIRAVHLAETPLGLKEV